MSQDGYVRLTADGPRVGATALSGPDALLFVDVEPGVLFAERYTQLRQLPHSLLADARWVLVRSVDHGPPPVALVDRLPVPLRRRLTRDGIPVGGLLGQAITHSIGPRPEPPPIDERAELDRQARALRLRHTALLHQPVGQRPWIDGDFGDQDLVDRARAAELEALLEWGHAIWRPRDYHYRLPSGEHTPDFVRLANAVRGPRDADTLASWLFPYLRDGLGFVLDTGTLTPIVLSAARALERAGLAVGPTRILDHYPTTDHDVARAVRRAGERNAVLALLSVNSSGQVLDRLVRACGSTDAAAVVAIVISRLRVTEHRTEREGVVIDFWHPRPGREPAVRPGTRDRETCELCRERETSTLVPVAPGTFEATLKAAVHPITPSISDPQTNRPLWELCDALDGIRLETPPAQELAPNRPPGPMPIRLTLDQMVEDESFRRRAVRGFERTLHGRRRDDLVADVVLVPHRELDLPGMRGLIEAMEPIFGRPEPCGFVQDEEWPAVVRATVRRASRLAVLTLGTVTGSHLYQALAGSQELREPGELLAGYVVHARLAEQRAWKDLENAYAWRLFTAWHSYLRPRSPLTEERELLTGFDVSRPNWDYTEAAEAYRRRRLEYCTSPDPASGGLFWGSSADDHLTPNSIYGEALHGPAVYVAVASAMDRARKETLVRAEPQRRVFDLEGMARSYYDPLILSAMLRWLEPHEAWWGWQLEDSRTIVGHMLSRLKQDRRHLAILESELLLAAAQGKLEKPAIGMARAAAEALLDSVDADQRAALELGLALAPPYGTQDQERAREREASRRDTAPSQ